MQDINFIAEEYVSIDDSRVVDADGNILAMLFQEEDGPVLVVRQPPCSIGDYFYILRMLNDLGYEVA